jgi:hypothetical protein
MERIKINLGQLWTIKPEVYYRNHDLPAIIWGNKSQEWCSIKCRERDLPSCIFENGTKHWFKNCKSYRKQNLPTIVSYNGMKFW